ncbi:hypothetical protein ES703_69364 [subsurface metagenome]
MPENEIVVYERGKEVTKAPKRLPPELLQIIMLDDIQVALTKVNKHLEKAEFEGVLVPWTLSATDEIQHIAPIFTPPDIPWISAYFINDGPDEVEIGINAPYDRFVINPAETITVNRAHADERINIIYYICNPGETASVRVVGEY